MLNVLVWCYEGNWDINGTLSQRVVQKFRQRILRIIEYPEVNNNS